jgi:hypothetical protein
VPSTRQDAGSIEGIQVPKARQITTEDALSHNAAAGTRVALWWLRHFESIIRFWTGFSWVWVIGVILSTIMGHLEFRYALCIILLVGVISNTGIYCGIRTIASYLKGLKDGPDKEEAHKLMIQIIKRRMLKAS